ncbi:MAG TPA: hypothetical protein VFI00_08465, partial [Kribbella sp.]|nr:hypothetical protein [Kribbella sp.]
MPLRQDNGSASRRKVAMARLSAFLLVVVAGLLATAQAANATATQEDVSYLNSAHQINLSIIQA